MLERGYEIACRLSVRCLSVRPYVKFRYRDQIGWNSSQIILRPNSLRPMRSLTPNMGDLVQREHLQNYGGIGVASGAVRSPKRCKIGPKLLLRTNRKSHMRFDWHQIHRLE